MDPTTSSEPAVIRIPLTELHDYLADNNLRVVGVDRDLNAPPGDWHPTLFLAPLDASDMNVIRRNIDAHLREKQARRMRR